jgi:hypothetical protein
MVGAYYPGPPVPTPATREVDRAALTNVLLASVLALVGGAVGIVVLFGAGAFSLYSVWVMNAGSTIAFGALFVVVVLVSGAVEIAVILLLRTAFHGLKSVDARFSTPSTLTLMLVVGFILILVSLYPLLLGVGSQLDCLANAKNTLAGSCPPGGYFLAAIALIGIGGLIAFIGFIGMLLGIWRLGSRYNNDLFKVGAILLIIPVLSVVGAILVLVASSSERDRVSAAGRLGTPSF